MPGDRPRDPSHHPRRPGSRYYRPPPAKNSLHVVNSTLIVWPKLVSAQPSEELVLYCARHDYGTRVLTNTGNLAAVMRTMGHRDVRPAMQHQHPDLEIVRSALNQTNRLSLRTAE